ncbi:hypothetical protein Tco_1139918 [Tanacetum coccineum]
MLNTNTNLQTQTLNALHNAIMEAGGKDCPPILAPSNYVQWKSRIKKYIDTKPNNELIHYFLQNPSYKFKWTKKTVPVAEGSSERTIEGYMENYKNVSQDIRDQLNVEAEAVQIILTGIDNDIYSTVDACPNACEMWNAIERLKQGESINVCKNLETQFIFRKLENSQYGKVKHLESFYSRFYQDVNERDDTDDEPDDQELEAHYMYMAQFQEVTLDDADNSGPIFDTEPLQKDDQDGNDDLARECDLLASLIEKLKCEIEDFKTNNKSLESSNNHFKEANNELSKTNQLMFKDLKKFQAELDRYRDVNYASKVAIDCAKAKGDLMSYKMESLKSFNEYTRKINDLNQTILEMKKELFVHQETISIMSQEKEVQKKFHKTREDKELDKVIALENTIKVLDDIVYKTGQSVQTMNMLNRNCKTSFVKPKFLKKAQREIHRLYDIGCYNDNLALILAPESDKTIRLAQESGSKLSDLIRTFDFKKLNNLYDLFVPQLEKSPDHRYFSERSKMSHTPVKNENLNESFNK